MDVMDWQSLIGNWLARAIVSLKALEKQGLKRGDAAYDRAAALIGFLEALLFLVQAHGIPEWVLDILEPLHLEFEGTSAPDRPYDGLDHS